LREFVALADPPNTIELVVRVDAITVFEVSEKRLAARFYIANSVTTELPGMMPQTGYTEAHCLNILSFEDGSDLIGCASNFWSFGHVRVSPVCVKIVYGENANTTSGRC